MLGISRDAWSSAQVHKELGSNLANEQSIKTTLALAPCNPRWVEGRALEASYRVTDLEVRPTKMLRGPPELQWAACGAHRSVSSIGITPMLPKHWTKVKPAKPPTSWQNWPQTSWQY